MDVRKNAGFTRERARRSGFRILLVAALGAERTEARVGRNVFLVVVRLGHVDRLTGSRVKHLRVVDVLRFLDEVRIAEIRDVHDVVFLSVLLVYCGYSLP